MHADFQPDGALPLGPSAIPIPPDQKCYIPSGDMVEYPAPKALSKEEIRGIIQDYADGAHNAIEAGAGGRFCMFLMSAEKVWTSPSSCFDERHLVGAHFCRCIAVGWPSCLHQC